VFVVDRFFIVTTVPGANANTCENVCCVNPPTTPHGGVLTVPIGPVGKPRPIVSAATGGGVLPVPPVVPPPLFDGGL
jgi:hypothetical protein